MREVSAAVAADHEGDESHEVTHHPHNGHRHHRLEIEFSVFKWTLCHHGYVGKGVEKGIAKLVIIKLFSDTCFPSSSEDQSHTNSKVDCSIGPEHGDDDSKAASLEQKAAEETD